MKTNTLPPKTIYDVLHKAEAAGIEIPKEVDQWWKVETEINMIKIDIDKTNFPYYTRD